MSKESIIKKRLEKEEKQNKPTAPAEPAAKQPAVGPVMLPLIQRRRRRLNRKFILTFAIWIVALIAALFFLTQRT